MSLNSITQSPSNINIKSQNVSVSQNVSTPQITFPVAPVLSVPVANIVGAPGGATAGLQITINNQLYTIPLV